MKFSNAPKFRAKWTTAADGTRHPSKGQAAWWDKLVLKARAGLIRALEREPRFDVYIAPDCPYCRDHGVRVGMVKADAAFDDENGVRHVVDFKGGEGETDISKFKRKIVAARFGVEIELDGPEVKRAARAKARKTASSLRLGDDRTL